MFTVCDIFGVTCTVLRISPDSLKTKEKWRERSMCRDSPGFPILISTTCFLRQAASTWQGCTAPGLPLTQLSAFLPHLAGLYCSWAALDTVGSFPAPLGRAVLLLGCHWHSWQLPLGRAVLLLGCPWHSCQLSLGRAVLLLGCPWHSCQLSLGRAVLLLGCPWHSCQLSLGRAVLLLGCPWHRCQLPLGRAVLLLGCPWHSCQLSLGRAVLLLGCPWHSCQLSCPSFVQEHAGL